MPNPRIIAGAWRGRALATPPGAATRPTAGRVRQALFDMLRHASWAEHDLIEGATVLDAFAGSGALGLEALSRGAARATFFDTDPAALASLAANITACRASDRARALRADALNPPPGTPHTLILLDPPYGQNLIPRALAALARTGWLAPAATIAAEFGKSDPIPPDITPHTTRPHGAARLVLWSVG